MSIIMRPARQVKTNRLHPLAPIRPITRPFGEGLVEPEPKPIPAHVARIRVTSEDDGGVWAAYPVATGRRWRRESDGRTMGRHLAEHLNGEGEVEYLAAPKPVDLPEPKRTPVELAFAAGYRTALNEGQCIAPRFAGPDADDLTASWLLGWEDGNAIEVARWEAMAEAQREMDEYEFYCKNHGIAVDCCA